MLFYPRWGSSNDSSCGSSNYILFSMSRPMKAPGEVISLPSSRVTTLMLNDVDATKRCTQWTGTLTWNSDVPSWSVTLDATCSETGKSGIKLVGTFSGDV